MAASAKSLPGRGQFLPEWHHCLQICFEQNVPVTSQGQLSPGLEIALRETDIGPSAGSDHIQNKNYCVWTEIQRFCRACIPHLSVPLLLYSPLCELCPCHTGYLGIPGTQQSYAASGPLHLPQPLPRTLLNFYVDYFSGLHPSQLLEMSTPKASIRRPFLIALFTECYVHCLPQESVISSRQAHLMVSFSVASPALRLFLGMFLVTCACAQVWLI